MNDFIYKLNLPSIENIVDQLKFSMLVESLSNYSSYHKVVPSSSIIKSEWLTLQGIEFDSLSIFVKNNVRGIIHSDDRERLKDITECPVWAINWIYNGKCTLEFWEKNNILGTSSDLDTVGSYHTLCHTIKPPDKIYHLEDFSPYLVNASIPHRATGIGHRYTFSLRPTQFNLTWPQVVNNFKDLIWSGVGESNSSL